MDVSTLQLNSQGRVASIDAIAVMTAMDRDQISAVLRAGNDFAGVDAEEGMTAAVRLLVGWHTDRDYVGPYGLIQDLEFVSSGERKNSFTALAKRYCGDFSPEVLLEELVRTKCVTDLGNGFFRAMTRLYMPEKLSPESIRRFAQVVHNVSETLEFNLRKAAPGSGRIERTVFADFGLPPAELVSFNDYIRERGQKFADDIDNWLSTRSKEDQPNSIQTGIGFYHYVVNEADEKDFSDALITEHQK